jgi:hypothetical protein
MKPIIRPIQLNESSLRISLLHKVLQGLGFPVSKKERSSMTAGENTLKQVRALQDKLKVRFNDSFVVDQATFEAITDEMQRSSASGSQSFLVMGTLYKRTGEIARYQRLVALDVDLRGAAIYRTAKTLDEIKKNGGFEFLGETSSTVSGIYVVEFFDWQFAAAERKKADVVVYAVDGDDTILGRSRIVNSNDYSESGEVKDIDILIVNEEEKTEYDNLMNALTPFLEESKVVLADLAKSADQVAFTAAELDEPRERIQLAVDAEVLETVNPDKREEKLSHEILYGIGRQRVPLNWPALYELNDEQLKSTVEKSVAEHIIKKQSELEIAAFLQLLHSHGASFVLDHTPPGKKISIDKILSATLTDKKDRLAFIGALRDFKNTGSENIGEGYKEFWRSFLPSVKEFSDNPGLVTKLLLNQQLTLISGDHQPLIEELQNKKQIASVTDLLKMDSKEWENIISKTGVPSFIKGNDEQEKAKNYAEQLQNTISAVYPTQKIAAMLAKGELPVKDANVAQGISKFLNENDKFDFSHSRIHDFEKEINEISSGHHEQISRELKRMQRIFQVSTTPAVMSGLMETNLNSAYSIAGIPRKSFIKMYSQSLGGELAAESVYERATHISTLAAERAMKIYDIGYAESPAYAYSEEEYHEVVAALEKKVPNYATLFGSPDICECEQCRSVYSAAAYFVDLLRFLWRGVVNATGDSPLDMFKKRRPDLLHLPLTCENTNTIIPYIDLVNEIMEYYTCHGTIDSAAVHDTGEAIASELRANPQNFEPEAYRILKKSVYPFSLPYHQPLDVIRTYSDHLKTGRYDVMKELQKDFSSVAVKAISSEALRISEEEFSVLTTKKFDGTDDVDEFSVVMPKPTRQLHQYFGYSNSVDLEKMAGTGVSDGIHEFLRRSGIKYTDLVELIKTKFINPRQHLLDFLENLFVNSTVSASVIYAKLGQIKAGTLDPSTDADIMAVLPATLSAADFGTWVQDNFDDFNQIITLYQSTSICDLDTTYLRIIQHVYSGANASGITNDRWSKIHRFIRLWRKLGWKIYEVDLMLAALGETDITDQTISKLSSVVLLNKQLKLPINKLAVIWGNIDTYGDRSLYKKLFLNKAVKRIDTAFEADDFGNYLTDSTLLLADHIPAILSAFRMSEDDLAAILATAFIKDGVTDRLINPATDKLTIFNLSVIYRYTVLSKSLKLKVPDFCLLLTLFGSTPFSKLDVTIPATPAYLDISPANTVDFFELATSIKKAGFKAVMLQYIFNGDLPAESTLGLNEDKAREAAHSISEAFASIEQDQPNISPVPLTEEIIRAKLSLTFQPEVVGLLIAIIDGTAVFDEVTDANLTVAIPSPLSEKYSYIKASGRLSCTGVMSDGENAALKLLAGANANFKNAVDAIYKRPEDFIKINFSGVLSPMNAALAILLDHPAQVSAATLEEKFTLIYDSYLPLLKQKLREDAITQHIASLIGLSEEATAVLIKSDMQSLIDSLALHGFSAEYFSDGTWTTSALTRTDSEIDFEWGTASPHVLIPADNFSVRWQSYLSPPSSGEYTLLVNVKGADEAFKLYLDGTLILEKPAANVLLSWEKLVSLNASQMHRLVLEYAEGVGGSAVSLSWKTATSALEIIVSTAALPATAVDGFVSNTMLYHRAARFILGFNLIGKEISHFLNFSADFAGIDFKAITPSHWRRINDFVQLRNGVPQTQALLVDVFMAANQTSPVPSINELTNLLYLATAWDNTTITYFINTYFTLTVNDFKNEIALIKLYKAVTFVFRTGISAQTLAEWATPATDFDALNTTADLVKNTVKAKYEEEDWLKLAGDLSDKIRENQKQALISYLLTRQELQDWGVADADGLFEYFLIDVQMGACMDTSRIVQANAAIQMFVNRCLLNLESDKSSGSEKGVAPDSIDKDRWEWMEFYRVWEVNRKIFLYPENWLEPEWRDDRSYFFKDLESELVQNDISDRSVETAFRNYLSKLNTVANLNVCGMYQENDSSGKQKLLHVVGHTHNAPYQFFYRTCNKYGKWSAWDKLPVDIRLTEDGDNSGVHTIPVVWKNRLFVFWPEFIKKESDNNPKNSSGGDATFNQCADKATVGLRSSSYYEIRLAWTEYADAKWSPKQLSKEFLVLGSNDPVKVHAFRPLIDSTNQSLYITLRNNFDEQVMTFILTDIEAPIVADYTSIYFDDPYAYYTYSNHFEKHFSSYQLILRENMYLKKKVKHTILYSSQWMEFEKKLIYPFFYNDNRRTYFVKPVDIRILDQVKNPDQFAPVVVDKYRGGLSVLVDDSVPGIETYMPGYGIVDPSPEGYITTGIGREAGTPVLTERAVMDKFVTKSISISKTPPEASAKAMSFMPETKYAVKDLVYLDNAFTGIYAGIDKYYPITYRPDKGFEFYTFYHPFSGQYATNLNSDGIKGLMDTDTKLNSGNQPYYNDSGTTFVNAYNPDFTSGLVQKAPVSNDYKPGEAYTFYKENICFDVFGANSLYNWELFFHVPMYIATRLSRNGKYEEAMKWFHYIFDPTTDEMPLTGQPETARYWKVLPFKTTPKTSLEEWFKTTLGPNTNPAVEEATIGEWRDYPFRPFVIARNRPLAFMKNVVIKYVENLRLWGDSLFRMFTRESVNEALQIYVLASHILGPKPAFVPKRGKIKAETYDSLKDKWDDFSNALVDMENIFPYSSSVPVSPSADSPAFLGLGSALYFCIPGNDKLLEHWDTIADRLYKIRHCMDIDGVERHLALFSPPIDPAMLINAAAQGLSLGSILSDLSSPPPIYRFTYLIQKANEFCNEVKSLGSMLLSILEKKDAEELARLRASHETSMLELMTFIRERQVLDAKVNKENLLKMRDTAALRLEHYSTLMSEEAITVPAPPTISATLTADSELPPDTDIKKIESDVDDSLVDSGESGVKIISKEKQDLDLSEAAKWVTSAASLADGIAAVLHLIPQVNAHGTPIGVGAALGFGGVQIGGVASGVAHAAHGVGTFLTMQAAAAQKTASYIRREQDWTLQANIAAKEIIQLDKQITSADIRIQVANQELFNHKRQIENSQEVERFLRNKFTNQELYQWMKEQLFAVYKQSYNMAYDMARKVEKCYQFEIGNEVTSFIQYGYWDNTQQGLCSGEKLQLALRQLEKSYLEENKREFELTKSISMALANPLALQELRTAGKCFIKVPEELFDMDYQGHYFRRIKSVSLSLPCIAGPYTTVSCTLRLLKNTTRINTSMSEDGNYEHNNDEGIWIDDDRFRESNIPVKAIAASTGQHDSGVFELNFRDDRYLPFEGAGAISEWKIELTRENELRLFDYSTISDVILHIKYTAREDAGLFKESAVTYLKNFLTNLAELTAQPLLRMFSMKHEFSTDWHKFLFPAVAGADQLMTLSLTRDHFPFFTKDRTINIKKIEVLIDANRSGDYKMIFGAVDTDDNVMVSTEINMPENSTYANMQKATLSGTVAGVSIEDINAFAPITFKFRHNSDVSALPQKYNFIDTDPEEITDFFVVLHYALGD